MDRVMIFIDGNNLYQGAKDLLGQPPKIDFSLFSQELIQPNQKLMRTYYYSALSDKKDNPLAFEKQKSFLDSLKLLPRFEVVTGYLQKKSIPHVKFDPTNPKTYVHTEKGTDVSIATDMLSLAYDNSYDVCILVSADSDYVTVIDRVKARGKIVQVAVAKGSRASQLRQHSDEFIELDAHFFAKCSTPDAAVAPTNA